MGREHMACTKRRGRKTKSQAGDCSGPHRAHDRRLYLGNGLFLGDRNVSQHPAGNLGELPSGGRERWMTASMLPYPTVTIHSNENRNFSPFPGVTKVLDGAPF